MFLIVRKSKEDSIELPDPNPNMDANDVMKFYSSQYPELTSATITGPVLENKKNSLFIYYYYWR
jgi:PRTRC genetic system protein C